ncbi:hypothetical protein SAMN04488543_3653 [Friedmanniella luteola]|uniref:Uncharacterized protein n=1 Tax=Friedmanniella luteola TaxID=546871 RepID=A0A1H1ZAG2_9ACTN|nr:hypothetical protein [Friedmanniella luteola]SDT30761.1 hypothetical protein SAMN04488543_3653 [Friedmanniella luteola]
MRTSRTARKVVAGISAAVVSLLLVGGTAATITTDDAGRGVKTVSTLDGRGV